MRMREKVDRFLRGFNLEVCEYPADEHGSNWYMTVWRMGDPSAGLDDFYLDGDLELPAGDYKQLWEWLISDEGKAALLDAIGPAIDNDLEVIEQAIADAEKEAE